VPDPPIAPGPVDENGPVRRLLVRTFFGGAHDCTALQLYGFQWIASRHGLLGGFAHFCLAAHF
jgi:hypothetical protein